ncbi:MAG: aldo/keto reductase [Terrimicrobiaceae bacterium]|nr:aldo/keto reductase [Terrimicrobiaceae bacterium]
MKSEAGGRRDFLKRIGLAGAGMAAASLAPRAGAEPPAMPPVVPTRKFGRHDVQVSSLALGGHALRVADDAEARRIVDEALAIGVTFFDNAWDYHDGRAEELMGRLIENRRQKVFLMTKVCTHDHGKRGDAMRMLEESLRRFRTDYLDLWQVHAVSSMAQVERAFGPEGVMEALDAARQQGKVRFVGFTGHTDPDVHLAMLAKGYAFDACQLPVSPIEANSNAFVRRVLPELVRQNIAPLAMKTLGGNGRPVQDGVLSVREGITYGLTQPVCTVVSGINTVAQLRENAGIAAGFSPMSAAQIAALEERCREATESDKYQPYRRWMAYRDGHGGDFPA